MRPPETYRRLRDPFELTFSPFLPLGLNLGRQLYYLRQTHPELFRACAAILLTVFLYSLFARRAERAERETRRRGAGR